MRVSTKIVRASGRYGAPSELAPAAAAVIDRIAFFTCVDGRRGGNGGGAVPELDVAEAEADADVAVGVVGFEASPVAVDFFANRLRNQLITKTSRRGRGEGEEEE